MMWLAMRCLAMRCLAIRRHNILCWIDIMLGLFHLSSWVAIILIKVRILVILIRVVHLWLPMTHIMSTLSKIILSWWSISSIMMILLILIMAHAILYIIVHIWRLARKLSLDAIFISITIRKIISNIILLIA